MTGLSLVKISSKSVSLNPCGCSVCGSSFMRSTTLTTRIFRPGRRSRRMETAASVSSVGTSPQQAMTTSGATPWSLLAHCQMPMPSVVATAGHDHVGRNALVVAGPLPDANALGAVLDGGVHRQPLRRRVFACDHDVDVMAAAQAVVHHRQQAVRVRRKVNPHDLGLLVYNVIDETGILVRKAVVILAPDM